MRMQKLILPITIMAAFIIGANGCSSVNTRLKGNQSGVYPGVKAGTEAYKKADGITENSLTIVDLPLSFALDTVLLPFDLLGITSKGKKAEESAAPAPAPKPAPKP